MHRLCWMAMWVGASAALAGCVTKSQFAELTAKSKKASAQVADSLTIKPRVVPADDPVRLSSTPPQIPAGFYTQAAWYAEQQGNLTVAGRQYEKALEVAPQDLTALISYARFLDRTGHPDDALRIYQRAQAAAPKQALVWNDLGLFHARRSEWQAAVQALNQAVALQPDNPRYRNNLAAVLIEAQRPEDAVKELVRVHPEAVARYQVGQLLCVHQRYAAAAEYFRQAVQLDPTLDDAQRMLTQLPPTQQPFGEPVRPLLVSARVSGREVEVPQRLPAAGP